MQLKTVSTGQLCALQSVDSSDSLVVIVDFFDHTKVLVDGIGIERQAAYVKHLKPLDKKISISRTEKKENIEKILKEECGEEIKMFTKKERLSIFDEFKIKLLKERKEKLLEAKL